VVNTSNGTDAVNAITTKQVTVALVGISEGVRQAILERSYRRPQSKLTVGQCVVLQWMTLSIRSPNRGCHSTNGMWDCNSRVDAVVTQLNGEHSPSRAVESETCSLRPNPGALGVSCMARHPRVFVVWISLRHRTSGHGPIPV
jgi:hypothetical protein